MKHENFQILVVDDNQEWLDVVTSILQNKNFVVYNSHSIGESLFLLKSAKFCIAIVDVRLIDDQTYNCEGLSLLAHIKEFFPKMGTIVLTGYPNNEQKKILERDFDIDGYLSKGVIEEEIERFTADKLIFCINKIIKGRYTNV
jgi:ActR/RegA family two-component response regulator